MVPRLADLFSPSKRTNACMHLTPTHTHCSYKFKGRLGSLKHPAGPIPNLYATISNQIRDWSFIANPPQVLTQALYKKPKLSR